MRMPLVVTQFTSIATKIASASLALAVVFSPLLAHPAGAQSSALQQADFSRAAKEFNVPENLLLAIAYNQSRWEHHGTAPSTSGGYGVMHLTAPTTLVDGRGDGKRPVTPRTTGDTLMQAAKLLNSEPHQLKTDPRQNIRGAAALLAKYSKETSRQSPLLAEGWYEAVKKISGASHSTQATEFALSVYSTLKTGVARSHDLEIEPNPAIKLPQAHSRRQATPAHTPECPRSLDCRFTPARHAQNNPTDPSDYGNYDVSNRPKDMKVKYIVIHDTEGSYQSAIDWFQNPASYTSAHYVIRSADGEVTQMVPTKDVAWHAGNWYMNMHSIGIEHEGFAARGATWYSEAMYRSSAKLVRHLAKKYNIPLDREHIIGHDQFQALTPQRVAAMHTDPGPYWNWDHYMDLVTERPARHSHSWGNKNAVSISPNFASNKPVVTDCSVSPCQTLPSQGANFVYLRAQPNHDAPLINDIGIHPDGSAGTTNIDDSSATATHGQRFAFAGKQGDWTAIWFNSQKAWFYNPAHAPVAKNTQARLITPKPDKASIPIYGGAYPEASAYPTTIPRPATVPLQYTIDAGQKYVAYDPTTPTGYFYAWTYDRSLPDDGTVVKGSERFIPIAFNHRQAYVKASDVTFVQ